MLEEMFVPGLIEQPFDPRDVWADEILVGGNTELPARFRIEDLKYEGQGAYPLCTAMIVTKMIEFHLKEKGIMVELSPLALFAHGGGTRFGATFRGMLEAARKGNVTLSDCPMPDEAELWNMDKFEISLERGRQAVLDPNLAIPGYLRVKPDHEEMAKYVIMNGPLMVGVAASGGYWADRAKRPPGKDDDHATGYVGYETDLAKNIFDSLLAHKNFDGYHTLAPNYEFYSVYTIPPFMPENWKQKVEEKREAPPNNENYYGKRRDLALEQTVGDLMKKEFLAFKDKSVFEAAGRFWLMYIRAVAYGGYNISYEKDGKWMPGDIINDCYHWRRTGDHIFNFDLTRV